ncbi:hypothetical protein BJ912DRAFT_1002095 [Pholiota molesta]|nr:hypothetical protein BJ912DRAFT_1002095 [Pholiota molesta]
MSISQAPRLELEDAAQSTNNLRQSPLFSDSDADLAFVSADGITFRIYSKYLEATSAGLAPLPILLTESAAVLEVLFQFVHPRSESEQYHQPSVAEAAEKYLVYGAMNICMTYMHQVYSSHPVEVLNHCANHGYDALADKAAIVTISLSNTIDKALGGLKDPGVAFKWMKYYGHWLQIPKLAGDLWTQEEARDSSICHRRAALISAFLHRVTANLSNGVEGVYTAVNCTNPRGGCDCNAGNSSNWQIIISRKIRVFQKRLFTME